MRLWRCWSCWAAFLLGPGESHAEPWPCPVCKKGDIRPKFYPSGEIAPEHYIGHGALGKTGLL